MTQRGQFAVEFAVLCALLAVALLMRDSNGESVAAAWLSAWWQFISATHAWLALY